MDAVKLVEADGVFFHEEAAAEKSSCLAQSGLHLHVYMGIWGGLIALSGQSINHLLHKKNYSIAPRINLLPLRMIKSVAR